METEIFITATISALIVIILGAGIVIFFVINQRKKTQHIAEQHRHQQELLQTRIEIQQQSFENISHELHDNIGQVLSLIKLNLARVTEQTAAYPFHEKLEHTLSLTGRVITDLRNLAKGLNPDFVQQFGLPECIRFELDRLEYAGEFTTEFKTSGEPNGLEPGKAFVVYRVVQECLNNIIKHVRSGAVHVSLNCTGGMLNVSIADKGNGFDMASKQLNDPVAKGSGLANMKKRIEMIGGTFNCESSIGKGTTVQFTVPLNQVV